MPSEIRTPKNLPEWIELDYHRRRRSLRRWRRTLTWGMLAICLTGVAVAMMLPGSQQWIQPQPLSRAHSLFNHDCAQCHQQSFASVHKLTAWRGSLPGVPDRACLACHDGHPHNEYLLESVACASCHREHRGRMELARVPDGHCTQCHADLKNHRRGGADGLKFLNVTDFNRDHPEFALIRNNDKDPTQLHFNHEAHLRPGGTLRPDGTKQELQCVHCHQPDRAGQHMEPIHYNKHCADCHPLFVRLVGDFKGNDLEAAVERFNRTPVPHKEPATVRAVLRERLLEFAQTNPVVIGEAREELVDPDLLGKRIHRPRMPTEIEWHWTRDRLSTLERLLFPEQQREVNEQLLFQNVGGCRLCHIEKEREIAGDELGGLPVYEPAAIPSQWMKHARFDHAKHRALDCAECHDARASSRTSDVLMPALASCQQCHNASTRVRTDCAACHTYHNRALEHETHRKLTIRECLGK